MIKLNEKRRCLSCRQDLPSACFRIDPTVIGGLSYLCPNCERVRDRECADRDHERYLEIRARQLKKDKENREFTRPVALRLNHRKRWSSADDALLVEYHGVTSPAVLATCLGRTYNAVISRASHLCLAHR